MPNNRFFDKFFNLFFVVKNALKALPKQSKQVLTSFRAKSYLQT